MFLSYLSQTQSYCTVWIVLMQKSVFSIIPQISKQVYDSQIHVLMYSCINESVP